MGKENCTAEGLVAYAKKALETPNLYMWGGIGEYITSELVEEKIRRWPDWHIPERAQPRREMANRGLRGWDCIGLIQSYCWGDYHQGNTQYFNRSEWISTAQLIKMDLVKGDINTLPERPGLVLWKPGHVGVYIGNGEVIESTRRIINPDGTDGGYTPLGGMTKTRVENVPWEVWLEYPGITY